MLRESVTALPLTKMNREIMPLPLPSMLCPRIDLLRQCSPRNRLPLAAALLLLALWAPSAFSQSLPASDSPSALPSQTQEPLLAAWVQSRTSHRDAIQQSIAEQFAKLFREMSPAAKRGYQHLTGSVYLPADFDEAIVDQLDRLEHAWPMLDRPLPDDARQATWLSYGLAARPDDPQLPLQYVVTQDQRYVMNCFACHGGNLYGATYPGSPNSMYALQSLTEDVRKTKIRLGKKLTHMDIGSLGMPLGTSNGTSNAVMFGVALMNFRDADLNVHTNRFPAPMTHHDMDAPAWWLFHRKHHLYIDGFAQKGHRGLMQFMMVRENGPKQFQGWERDFQDIYQFLSELRPPRFPLPVDGERATRGERVFNANCAHCHGTYQRDASGQLQVDYPERMVPIDDIATDPVRWSALSPAHRKAYGDSWFADYGAQQTLTEVDGYIAPPLDGIWASAPYLHNGSVPTLWHLLHPESRPAIWRRLAVGLDEDRMGIVAESLSEVPSGLRPAERRWIFDSRAPGKSASGHDYPAALSEAEKEDLLEYLKTL